MSLRCFIWRWKLALFAKKKRIHHRVLQVIVVFYNAINNHFSIWATFIIYIWSRQCGVSLPLKRKSYHIYGKINVSWQQQAVDILHIQLDEISRQELMLMQIIPRCLLRFGFTLMSNNKVISMWALNDYEIDVNLSYIGLFLYMANLIN